MADHFNPAEARDPAGKWVKLAQGLKKLAESDKPTVTRAIGELPKGGAGNRISLKGVEIRRHQSGGVNVKIGGESRQYASHEDAARAIINRQHNSGGTLKAEAAKAKVPAPERLAPEKQKSPEGAYQDRLKAAATAESAKAKLPGKKVSVRDIPEGYHVRDSGQVDYRGKPQREVYGPGGEHIADLRQHEKHYPQGVRGNVAYGGFKVSKGWEYHLKSERAKNAARDISRGRASHLNFFGSMLEGPGYPVPIGQAARSSIKSHRQLIERSSERPGEGHTPKV